MKTAERRHANNESLKKVVDNLRRVVDGSAKRELNTLGDKGADRPPSDETSGDDGGAAKKPDRETATADAPNEARVLTAFASSTVAN